MWNETVFEWEEAHFLSINQVRRSQGHGYYGSSCVSTEACPTTLTIFARVRPVTVQCQKTDSDSYCKYGGGGIIRGQLEGITGVGSFPCGNEGWKKPERKL